MNHPFTWSTISTQFLPPLARQFKWRDAGRLEILVWGIYENASDSVYWIPNTAPSDALSLFWIHRYNILSDASQEHQ